MNILSFTKKKELLQLFKSWCEFHNINKGLFNLLGYLQINHLIDEEKAIEFIEKSFKEANE